MNVHTDWAGTLHAQALVALGADATNPECLPCHSVGYGDTGGFVDATTTAGLAGVQCESCHGAALDHVQNVDDKTLRPTVSISADVCGKCHTGNAQPTFDEWSQSLHAAVVPDVATSFTAGSSATTCGYCHSGDVRFASLIDGDPITDALLKGVAPANMNAVTCAICHDPHKQTGNAAAPEAGRDYQLRYAEATSPDPSNVILTIAPENGATGYAGADLSRYNLCQQCHHSRNSLWTGTSRGPHHSVQGSIYIGEMPMPVGTEATPLVPNERSVHRFVPAQCATCHVHREAPPAASQPAIMGHSFDVDTKSCSAVGCHPSEDDAVNVKTALQAEVTAHLASIASHLGNLSTWGYSSEGGPSSQTGISDTIKKIRYMYFYISNDGSLGVHNPAYVRAMLAECDRLLTTIGK